ncbi:tetratricopeptide repeat protein [Pontibacter cellulosilyticus]|uniref:Sel1 repeat family protein n=1 Tax=Pontibacter cellulosilyticus TaxID=1720253 RepID=A0A923SMK1_9BACT|nr:sel1 repeat family protein [Pontibacter cellulosilyticus]MBC5992275.1 sel1 repeat family protein [Pontibacter cellulosilyticus]
MRTYLYLLVAALLVSCTAGKNSPSAPVAGSTADNGKTITETDAQNNLVSSTSSANAADKTASGKIIFEGSNNLYELIDHNTAYFDQGYDVIIIKGNGNLIRLYHTRLLNQHKGADTLVMVGNKEKYVMAFGSHPGFLPEPATADTIQLKTQPFSTDPFTQGLEEGSLGQKIVSNLLAEMENGNTEAYHALGDVYNFGTNGVAISTVKAVSLYEYAATRGFAASIGRLGDIWYYGTFDFKPQKAKGLFYYRLGAKMGDEYCQRALAGL